MSRLRLIRSAARAHIPRPSPAVAIASVALFLALAGAIRAAIPDGTTLHGCYDNAPGKRVLYLLDTGESCNGGQVAISWNQTGPPGPPGERGPQGATGAEGPRGAIGGGSYGNFFNGARAFGNTTRYVGLPEDGSRFDLRVDVPAGLYTVTANGDFFWNGHCPPADALGNRHACTVYEQVICTLSASGRGLDYGWIQVGPIGAAIPLTATVRLFAPGSVHLYCEGAPGDPAYVISESLVATRVNDPVPPPREPRPNTHHLSRPHKPKVA